MTAVSVEQWTQIRAACDLLKQMAQVHACRGDDDAACVVAWLDHVGEVAAWQAVDRASFSSHEATALTLPLCEVAQ